MDNDKPKPVRSLRGAHHTINRTHRPAASAVAAARGGGKATFRGSLIS